MAFVTLLEAQEAASQAVAASQMTVEAQLRVASDAPLGQFDIFLSHSSIDKELGSKLDKKVVVRIGC